MSQLQQLRPPTLQKSAQESRRSGTLGQVNAEPTLAARFALSAAICTSPLYWSVA